MTTPARQEMMERADMHVGMPLRVVLMNVPAAEQVNALIQLASALACMNVAQAITYGLATGPLYGEAGRVAADMLADIITGAGLGGPEGEA